MTQLVNYYRADPLNPTKTKSKVQRLLEKKYLDLKEAYVSNKLFLFNYLYTLARNMIMLMIMKMKM